jgi:outer membrane immunogenic protein
MKKLLLAAIAVASFSAAPANAQAPLFNWTGVYVGANAGSLKGNSDGSLPFFGGAPFDTDIDRRFMFGLHAGAQAQWGNFVAGIEGGWSTPLGTDNINTTQAGPNCGNAAPCVSNFMDTQQVGGRLGLAWDRWLVYGTGGWARAKIQTYTTPTLEVANPVWHGGSFYGGGVEVALMQNVIFGVEYLHYSFDTKRHGPTTGVCPAFCNRDISADANALRARLSLLFGTGGR